MKKLITAFAVLQLALPLHADEGIRRGILLGAPTPKVVQGVPLAPVQPAYQQVIVTQQPVVTYSQVEEDDSAWSALGFFVGVTALLAILAAPFDCDYGHHASRHSYHHRR